MNLSPVRKKRVANYPSLTENKNHLHTLLSTNLPLRWKNSKIAPSIVSALLLISEMGRTNGYASETDTTSQTVEPVKKNEQTQEKHSFLDRMQALPPIFEHGEGRGHAGCIVIAPPVFISEDEARDIIISEFNKYGIIFNEHDLKLNNGIYLDGLSEEYDIGFVFVSTADYRRWELKSSVLSSVRNYDCKKLAERLRRKLKHNDQYLTAIFYDPMPRSYDALRCYGDEEYDVYQKALASGEIAVLTRARTMLQWQVQDFIAWMTCSGHYKIKNMGMQLTPVTTTYRFMVWKTILKT